MKPIPCTLVAVLAALALSPAGDATPPSSHREAPAITETPKVDATDFYMFRSYETGRQDFVTIVADYLPLQAPYGGPNYFSLDPHALYQSKIGNDRRGVEDIHFNVRF